MPPKYDDAFVRTHVWPMCMIFSEGDPNQYISGCFTNATWFLSLDLPCDDKGDNKNITCTGGMGVSHDEEAIVIVFREFYNLTTTFPGGGTVAKFWYNGFLVLWNGGMRDQFFSLKNKYPTYELWVTGFSMGGSLAGSAAAYISQLGYMKPAQIKMISFGETRIGYKNFADRYPSLVPYAYRVVHNHDIVPHIIPTSAGYQHHKNEIWYPNDMNVGDSYIECDAGENPSCSDGVPQKELTWSDHWYFHWHTCTQNRNATFLA